MDGAVHRRVGCYRASSRARVRLICWASFSSLPSAWGRRRYRAHRAQREEYDQEETSSDAQHEHTATPRAGRSGATSTQAITSRRPRAAEEESDPTLDSEGHAFDGDQEGEAMSATERAALYNRVSTIDQDPTIARHELRNAARARGMEIVLEIEETGSGSRNDRPGLQRLMEAARRNQIDAVLVFKLDRFGRSALDLLANIRTLSDEGVRFIAVSQSLDIRPRGDAISKLILAVLSGVAEFERSLVIERTRLGLEKARRAGKLLGRRVSRDAPEPRQVHALRASGSSWRAIASQLGCTSSAARRAYERLAGNGVAVRTAK